MKQSSITVAKGEKWVSLSLSLGDDLGEGRCARINNENFPINIKPKYQNYKTDDTRESKLLWNIAILSGAPYAFRFMNALHKDITVYYLNGFLDEEDIEGVSVASAIAIVDILGGNIDGVATGEWHQVASQ